MNRFGRHPRIFSAVTASRVLLRGCLMLASICLAQTAVAATVAVELDGVEGELKAAALAGIEISQYDKRDVSASQAHRLYDRAPAQIGKALEAYGYYNAGADGELKESAQGWTAILHVHAGEPVLVEQFDIAVPDPARDEKFVARALANFVPQRGQRFDHVAYEKSKALVQAALLASGYLESSIATHRVEVSRTSNRATIKLEWKPGPRYRYGATTFSGSQFNDGFLDRYIPWHEGDFYSQGQLLQMQQRLIDADYFVIVDVQPDVEHEHDGVVPIKINLGPAKRTIYTAGVFVDTDIGVGVRGSVTRRWINARGHKVKIETEIAQRLKTAATTYSIPLPGDNNHSYNFGVAYRDENTDTSKSKTASVVANDTQQWLGFTRSIGLHLLTGDFTVADQSGHSTLLYPEASLTRKDADDPTFVRHGYSLTLAARASPGLFSDTRFVQARADAKWIRGIGDNQRVILRGSLGTTQAGDFDKLPPELRFFGGGDRSIRGYGYQTIGPLADNGLVLGGENLVVASAEYEYYFKPNWGIATFLDAGDAFSGFNTYETKLGTGLGLRWRSPVGMVRIDIGTPIADKTASGVQLHIVIGPDL